MGRRPFTIIIYQGCFVIFSRRSRLIYASSALDPHISIEGVKLTHIFGRSFLPKSLHLLSSVNWTHRIPAGLPLGMPGIAEDIDIAMQQAAQPTLHSILNPISRNNSCRL
jgi:hypothetical protein